MKIMLGMLGDLLESLDQIVNEQAKSDIGILKDLFAKLNGRERNTWWEMLKRFLRKEPCWTYGQVMQVAEPKPKPSILELVSTVGTLATTRKFVAKDRFVVNTERNALVKISNLGDNFEAWFLSGKGKTEAPISEQTLRYHKLRQSSVDGPIITELGGEAKAETTLSEMFSLMKKQKNGEDGVLLDNGSTNIFHIKDQNAVLCTVFVDWRDDGWDVRACSVGSPGRWRGVIRVFSRDSDLKSSEPSVPV